MSFERFQEILDDLKDQIPDQVYLTLSNANMAEYNRQPVTEDVKVNETRCLCVKRNGKRCRQRIDIIDGRCQYHRDPKHVFYTEDVKEDVKFEVREDVKFEVREEVEFEVPQKEVDDDDDEEVEVKPKKLLKKTLKKKNK